MSGITENGFVIKRLSEIKSDIISDLKAAFPNLNTSDETVNGQLSSIFADRISDIWELAEDVYNNMNVETASGYALDVLCALNGVTRLESTFSTATLRIYGTASTGVPAGFEVSVENNEDAVFATDSSATISAAVDEIQKIEFSTVPTSGTWQLVFSSATTGDLAYNDPANTVSSALESLTSIGTNNVSVSGSYSAGFTIQFDNALSGVGVSMLEANNSLSAATTVSITITEVIEGGSYIDITATATTAGAIAASAGQINTIVSPLSGIAAATNKSDANEGSEQETDAELRERRLELVNTSNAGSESAIKAAILSLNNDEDISGLIIQDAIILSNRTSSVNALGQPAHSFTAFVYYPDCPNETKNEEIAYKIYEAAPAGIEPANAGASTALETITAVITDSQGFQQQVGFNHPTEKNIFVSFGLTTVVADYPGDDIVKAAIVAWGNELGTGQDVIVYGTNSLINTIGSIAGITDITSIDIGVGALSGSDANISIDDGSGGAVEISVWDSGNITIT